MRSSRALSLCVGLLACLLLSFHATTVHAGNSSVDQPSQAPGRYWIRISAAAPWSPRAGGSLLWYPFNTRDVNTGRVVAGPFMLMQGTGVYSPGEPGDREEVWASTNLGRTWLQVAVSVAFNPLLSAAITQDQQGRLYRIQGTDENNGTAYSDEWMSTNGAQSWLEQGFGFPSDTGRYLGTAVTGSDNTVYVLYGQDGIDTLLNDVWSSTNQGRLWRLVRSSIRAPVARSQHGSVMGRYQNASDALYLVGGYRGSSATAGDLYLNDVWVWARPSGLSLAWTRLTDRAAWRARGGAALQVSSRGVLAVWGGKGEVQGDDSTVLNDVWASLDGGYTWGQCASGAEYDDRTWAYTVLDADGYGYTMGGLSNYDHPVPLNDVWKTSISFDDVDRVASNCGLLTPPCGVGLSCLPSDDGFYKGVWGVSCAACRWPWDVVPDSNTSTSSSSSSSSSSAPFAASSSDVFSSSASSSTALPSSSSSSTAAASESSTASAATSVPAVPCVPVLMEYGRDQTSTVAALVVVLLIFVILAAVAVLAFLWWWRRSNSTSPSSPMLGGRGKSEVPSHRFMEMS